jgi:hypothetical protein
MGMILVIKGVQKLKLSKKALTKNVLFKLILFIDKNSERFQRFL